MGGKLYTPQVRRTTQHQDSITVNSVLASQGKGRSRGSRRAVNQDREFELPPVGKVGADCFTNARPGAGLRLGKAAVWSVIRGNSLLVKNTGSEVRPSTSSSQGYGLGKLFSLSRPLFLMSKMSMSIAYVSQQSELTRTSKSSINGLYSFLYFIPKS